MIILFSTHYTYASDPPEPPSSGHGQSGDLPPGGGAPLGGGTLLLLVFSSLYGVKRIYDLKKKISNEKIY